MPEFSGSWSFWGRGVGSIGFEQGRLGVETPEFFSDGVPDSLAEFVRMMSR